MERAMSPAEYLKRPYGRLLLPDPDQGYAAEIVEFPGCVAIGATPTEALANLDEQGQEIPEPFEDTQFSGRLGLRLGHHLHKRAAYFAQRDGISLNQFIVNCVSEQVGMRARPHYAILATPAMAPAVTLFFDNRQMTAPKFAGDIVSSSTGSAPPHLAKNNPWGQHAGS
jgi:hypothetical protein